MPLLSWILVGLVLGYLARFVTRRRFGFIRTLIAGLDRGRGWGASSAGPPGLAESSTISTSGAS